jgi:hypothetical protein
VIERAELPEDYLLWDPRLASWLEPDDAENDTVGTDEGQPAAHSGKG